MTIKRLENWPKLLNEFLYKHRDRPFKYGRNDCIMFPAQAAQAMTGINFIARNKSEGRDYSSRKEAEEMLKAHFEKDVEKVFTYFLGEPREDIGFARRGDLVVLMHGGEKIGGVIDDSGRRIACAGAKGLTRFSKREALKYWRLGE